MLLVLLAAIVATAAVIAAAVVAFVRTRDFVRTFRTFGAAVDDALGVISAKRERVAARAATVGPGELEPAIARLNASRAQLAVLLAAIDDVRAAATKVTGLRPRK